MESYSTRGLELANCSKAMSPLLLSKIGAFFQNAQYYTVAYLCNSSKRKTEMHAEKLRPETRPHRLVGRRGPVCCTERPPTQKWDLPSMLEHLHPNVALESLTTLFSSLLHQDRSMSDHIFLLERRNNIQTIFSHSHNRQIFMSSKISILYMHMVQRNTVTHLEEE